MASLGCHPDKSVKREVGGTASIRVACKAFSRLLVDVGGLSPPWVTPCLGKWVLTVYETWLNVSLGVSGVSLRSLPQFQVQLPRIVGWKVINSFLPKWLLVRMSL